MVELWWSYAVKRTGESRLQAGSCGSQAAGWEQTAVWRWCSEVNHTSDTKTMWCVFSLSLSQYMQNWTNNTNSAWLDFEPTICKDLPILTLFFLTFSNKHPTYPITVVSNTKNYKSPWKRKFISITSTTCSFKPKKSLSHINCLFSHWDNAIVPIYTNRKMRSDLCIHQTDVWTYKAKIQLIQYNILERILITIHKLHQMGFIDSNTCKHSK